jgi:hypothetical protein
MPRPKCSLQRRPGNTIHLATSNWERESSLPLYTSLSHPNGLLSQVIGGAQWTNGLYVPYFAFVSSRISMDLLELNWRRLNGSGTTEMSETIEVSEVLTSEGMPEVPVNGRKKELESSASTL